MGTWVEVVGPNVVANLAKQAGVDLTSGIVELLEQFGECVQRESRTRNIRLRRLQRVQTELYETYERVREEVDLVRNNILGGRLNDPNNFFVHRHPETSLPIVCVTLKSLPDIHINVPRHYASSLAAQSASQSQNNQLPMVTFGLRVQNYCGGRLTGPVAQAANKLIEECIQANWRLSVTEIIGLWVNAVTVIPVKDRIASELAHSHEIQKRAQTRSKRIRGKWKPKKLIEKQQ